jgi:hypothetical protein
LQLGRWQIPVDGLVPRSTNELFCTLTLCSSLPRASSSAK